MKTHAKLAIALAALALVLLSGCSTVLTHAAPEEEFEGLGVNRGVYRGARFSAWLMWMTVAGGEAVPMVHYLAMSPCLLPDLPLSIAADTLMLPWDLYDLAANDPPPAKRDDDEAALPE